MFQDSHGLKEANAAPITDQSQDVNVLGGSQNDTHTSITFSRSWQTCDPEDRYLNVSPKQCFFFLSIQQTGVCTEKRSIRDAPRNPLTSFIETAT